MDETTRSAWGELDPPSFHPSSEATSEARRRVLGCVLDRGAFVGAESAATLSADLDAIATAGGEPAATRTAAAQRIRGALSEARVIIERQFRDRRRPGYATARQLGRLNDEVVRICFRFSADHLFPLTAPTTAERVAVLAVGGSGRGETAPFSDVDLAFLTAYKKTAWSESVIEATLYMLWDLKLKVGHATRSIAETLRLATSDMTIRTALLERRFLVGDRLLAEEADQRLWDELFCRTGPEFVAAKLAERDARHKRRGGSRYLLEPDVKESKGGLRDLQTLFWIAKYLYRAENLSQLVDKGVFTAEEAARCRAASAQLWSARCGLHYLAGRAQEKLSFDWQVELADMFGYRAAAGQRPVERFMKRYFLAAKQVGDLTRIFCAALEQEHKKTPPLLGGVMRLFATSADAPAPFTIRDGRLTASEPAVFDQEPLYMLRLVNEAAQRALLIHPDALREMTRRRRLIDEAFRTRPEAQALLLSLMTETADPVRALRRLNETGLLERLLPDFGRVVGLMQFNMYHHYTVDEHTLLAIEIYRRIAAGELRGDHPIETQIADGGAHHRVMTVALLLHDIGKGLPEDHSVAGERIAWRVCPELGLDRGETELVAWLVRNHLAMSDFAQKRDVTDLSTIRGFADVVRRPSRLKLLYLFTACDIRAVGPGVWNGWKAQLLRQLYRETLALLTGDGEHPSRSERISAARGALRTRLVDWSDAAFQAHENRLFPTYWLGVSTETQLVHAEMMRAAAAEGDGGAEVTMRARPSETRDATEIAFYCADHPGLFARMTGAMAVARASVVDARAYTTKDGMALNTFWVQDENRGPFDDPARLEAVRVGVARTLSGDVVARDALAGRRKLKPRERSFDYTPSVIFDNAASDTFTVIETNGRDRVGLLHELSLALSQENVNIFSAIIATYGEHAVDVFYVKDVFGMKLSQPPKMRRVEDALTRALEAARPAAPTEAALRATALRRPRMR